MQITRRQFLGYTALGAATVGLAACGGSGESNLDLSHGNIDCSTVSPTIEANHGHTLTVPGEDVAAGVKKTYTLTNNGTHMHSLDVTAEDFARMTIEGSITVVTHVANGHKHMVILQCGSMPGDG